MTVALKFLSYDPNYSYDDDMEEDAGAAGYAMRIALNFAWFTVSNFSCSCRDDDGQFSDDEDISWKVRRGAVKCLEAVITTRREWILDCIKRIGPALIARFYGDFSEGSAFLPSLVW